MSRPKVTRRPRRRSGRGSNRVYKGKGPPPYHFDYISARREFSQVLGALEAHHTLFYQLGELGIPTWTESLNPPTAGVGFWEGIFINFMWNMHFWDATTFEDKIFIAAHECLHVYLSHGRRSLEHTQPQIANIAMDIVVNEMLTSNFGFDRDEISISEDLIWLNKVWPNHEELGIPYGETYEYYYAKLLSTIKEGIADGSIKMVGSGQGGMTIYPDKEFGDLFGTPLDDHEKLRKEMDQKAEEKLSDQLSRSNITDDEKKNFRELTEGDNKTNKDNSNGDSGGKQAGTIAGNCTYVAPKEKVKYNYAWTDIIKFWRMRNDKPQEYDEIWHWPNRRMHHMPDGMFIPVEWEGDDFGQRKRVNVWFYMDTSGSCVHLKDKFFTAARTFPPDRFDLRCFCFDTKVYDIDLDEGKLYGFGGTSFHIIEQSVQTTMKKYSCRYPDAVFVFTDGYGTNVSPEKPDRWFWFLDKGGSKTCIPSRSAVFQLDDFNSTNKEKR